MNSSSRHLTERFGSWALVTGATDGIGKASARRLASEGFNLVLVARHEARLRQARREFLADSEVQCEVFAADLSDLLAVERLVDYCAGLDVGLVVAAAGFGSSGPFLDANLAQETELIDLNCTSVAVLAWRFGQRFKTQGRGGLVLFSSVLAFNGVPWSANYAASKSYIQALGEALAEEWKPLGLSVLTSAPGPTNTGFAKRARLQLGRAQNADAVALETINALKRGAVFTRPGVLSKLLGWSLALLPRPIRVVVLGKIMQGMVRNYG